MYYHRYRRTRLSAHHSTKKINYQGSFNSTEHFTTKTEIYILKFNRPTCATYMFVLYHFCSIHVEKLLKCKRNITVVTRNKYQNKTL